MVDQRNAPKQTKKPKKHIVKAIANQISERAKAEAESQRISFRSDLRSKLETLLPTQLRWLLPFVEGDYPDEETDAEQAEAAQAIIETPLDKSSVQSPETLYRQYRCWNGDPLSCHFPQQTVQQDAKASACSECGFPVMLAEKSELRGSRGRYRIDRWLQRRGLGRLYQGTQVSDGQPIVIKEYLLPTRSFGESEIRQRKAAFTRVAGVTAVDGRTQDYRLITPWEAIADQTLERCYLITKGTLNTAPTLATYLATWGAMTDLQVRQVLNQVLQTLEFLHGQKARLPGGQVQQGIAHGNLSLESLLIVRGQGTEDRKPATFDRSIQPSDTNFFIYVCDLALWESLFELPTATLRQPSWQQDLVALGYIAFYLLVGRVRHPGSAQPIDPRQDHAWGTVKPDLKALILRLMEFDTPFESAAAARQMLLQLPPDGYTTAAIVPLMAEDEEPMRPPRIRWALFGMLGLALLASLIWWLWPKSESTAIAQKEPLRCCVNQVPGVPPGQFTYTAEKAGFWNNVLLADLGNNGTTLPQALEARQPKLQLTYLPEATLEQAIDQVKAGQRAFAITSLTEDLTADLARSEIAYDGLAVFVAFSYAKRDNSLPKQLRGQITLEQLQQLYTGQIKNWRAIGGPDLPVKLYAPTEAETVRIFEQRVLKTEQNIAQFRSLLPKTDSIAIVRTPEQITRLPIFQTLRDVIQNFEEDDRTSAQQIGAIAFGTFSQVFGQCSVYPLAIGDATHGAVQALVQDSGRPIDPTTDLCRNKGSYRPEVELFKTNRYPLAYPLAVVYPRDNSRPPVGEKFADMLRTQEGQTLLRQTGLVPLEEF